MKSLTIRFEMGFKALIFITMLVGVSYGMMRTFGDNCEEGEPCLGSNVICLASGLCGCSSSDHMTYDPASEACLTNLGKSCAQNSECILGAWCDSSGLCRCDNGSYASTNGNCLPKKSHNESCINDSECGQGRPETQDQPQQPLLCINGHCECDKRIDTYEEERRACVGLVDSECDLMGQDDCVSHAHCAVTAASMGKPICQCDMGYAKTSQGTCGRAYGTRCAGSQEPCADIHFICIEGKCRCKFPLHQVYDERTAECLSLVSGPCTFPRNVQMNLTGFHDMQKCVKNAHCVDKGYYSECECKPGFVHTKSGTCTPGYEEPCEPGDCDPDAISGLYCRNGFCDCLDLLQVYDSSIKTCRGLVGSRCSTEKPDCVEFASCVVPDPQLPGKCLCDKYSQEVVNRTCDYHV